MKNIQKNFYLIRALIFSIIVCIGMLFVTFLHSANDGDFSWYCALGRNIVNGSHNFYGADTFSWIANEQGLSQIQHSWLSTVLAYFCNIICGENVAIGSLLFTLIVTFLSTFVLSVTYLKDINMLDKSNLILYIISGVILVQTCIMARSRNFDILFLIMTLYLLQKSRIHGKFTVVILSVISVLWANLHGSSILFYFGLIAVFAIMYFIPDFHIGLLSHYRNKSKAKYCMIALVSSIICGLCNPYGYRLYGYAIFNNQSFTKENVVEWSPVALLNLSVILCLIILFVYFVILKNKMEITVFVPVLMTLAMSAIHCRMVSYLLITLIPVVYEIIRVFNLRVNPLNRKDIKLLKSVSALFCAVMIISSLFMTQTYTYDKPTNQLINYLKEKDFKRVYNDYNLGAYLIYDDVPEFVDARADFYTEDILSGAYSFMVNSFDTLDGADKFVDTYRFDAIILNQQSTSTVNYLLLKGWHIDYEDTYNEKSNHNYYVLIK